MDSKDLLGDRNEFVTGIWLIHLSMWAAIKQWYQNTVLRTCTVSVRWWTREGKWRQVVTGIGEFWGWIFKRIQTKEDRRNENSITKCVSIS